MQSIGISQCSVKFKTLCNYVDLRLDASVSFVFAIVSLLHIYEALAANTILGGVRGCSQC